jgi:uncharacterized spore protein YtfJ
MSITKNPSRPDADLAIQNAADAAARFTRVIEAIAAGVAARCHADAVFGTPVVRDGVTVIPVAQIIGGFGAGAGASSGDPSAHDAHDAHDANDGGGLGGGGGFFVSPVGVFELHSDGARFRRVQAPGAWSVVATLLSLLRRRLERPKP